MRKFTGVSVHTIKYYEKDRSSEFYEKRTFELQVLRYKGMHGYLRMYEV